MQVWAVLKPGFLALMDDPFETKLLDIIVFDVLPLPVSSRKEGSQVYLANHIKEHNLLRYAFRVSELFLSLLLQGLKILIIMSCID
jgi:phospholipase D1/2